MEIKLNPGKQQEFKNLSFSKKGKEVSGTFPDFLILGPQRTGTTWLSENMRLHPEIFLSIPKELYFFNRLKSEPKRSLHYDNLVKRSSGMAYYAQPKVMRELLKVFYFDYLITKGYKANQLEWYMQFFKVNSPLVKQHADKMKKMYGHAYKPTAFGEATASYAAMDEDIIAETVKVNPDIKAILMVRNPLDRAWSHAKKDLARNKAKKASEITDEDYIQYLGSEYLVKCGFYSKQIEVWKKYLKEGNLMIGRYDDLTTRPKGLVLDVFKFLGVSDKEQYISEDVDKVINPAGKGKFPEKVQRFLLSLYEDELKWLKEELGLDYLTQYSLDYSN